MYTPGSSGKKRKVGGCGECEACTRDDCRQCVYCKDMRKYGGPNKLRKRCALRRCVLKDQEDSKRSEEKKEKVEVKQLAPVDEPVQTTKSKRVIKQPKKLAPNHSAALSYDDNVGGEEPKPSSPAAAPPAKRRKLDAQPKKASKPEAPKSFGSGKRLAPPPSRPTRVPSPPNLPPPPSPIVTRVTRRAVRPVRRATRSSARNKKKKFVPKSLPFLVNTDIAGVIVRYEIRARNIAVQGVKDAEDGKENARNEWKLEEVINFFRGVYLFGEMCLCTLSIYVFIY